MFIVVCRKSNSTFQEFSTNFKELVFHLPVDSIRSNNTPMFNNNNKKEDKLDKADKADNLIITIHTHTQDL